MHLVLCVFLYLICETLGNDERGTFRVYDGGRATSLYQGPANYNKDGPPLASFIVTARPIYNEINDDNEIYLGSKKPIWDDDPEDNTVEENNIYMNNYEEDNLPNLQYHSLECTPGVAGSCTQMIDIDLPTVSSNSKNQYSTTHQPPQAPHYDGYPSLKERYKIIENKLHSSNNPILSAADTLTTKQLEYQLTPEHRYPTRPSLHHWPSSPYGEVLEDAPSEPVGGQYDPFSFHQNVRSKKESTKLPTGMTRQNQLDALQPVMYYQEPPIYNSHYTDSRLFAPSYADVAESFTQNARKPPTSNRRFDAFDYSYPSMISAEAPIMRDSITWKSSEHRDKHITDKFVKPLKLYNKKKRPVMTNDFNDYDWSNGWKDNKIDRRQSYLSLSHSDTDHAYAEPTKHSVASSSRPSSYYFPTNSKYSTRPSNQSPRPVYNTTPKYSYFQGKEETHSYFPEKETNHNEQLNLDSMEYDDSKYYANNEYDRYDNFDHTYADGSDENRGFLDFEPAVVNTGYVVSDEIKPTELDSMWSTYDERYGWSKPSNKYPEPVSNDYAGDVASKKKEPIKTWASLDVEKPGWEKFDSIESIIDSQNSKVASAHLEQHDKSPYGRWESTLKLDQVPFSRSTDGKPGRWTLLSSTKHVQRNVSGNNGTAEVYVTHTVPFVIVGGNSDKQKRVGQPTEKLSNSNSRRISKQIGSRKGRKRKHAGKRRAFKNNRL